ncbi:MAG: DUF401 family protein [Desulfovibrionaceae bacterium]
MNQLLHFLPLIKVLASFACMLAGIRMKLGIGLSILLGSVVLALLFAMPVGGFAAAAGHALLLDKAQYLAVILGLITVMSRIMESTGQTQRLLESLAGRIRSPRLRLVLFPALIGLLPMPGGAVFSAPLVKSAAEGMDILPLQLTSINYWFRHVWEMSWPLYPGIILASSLSGIPIGRLMLLLLPGVCMTLLLGWVFLLRPGVLPLGEELPMAAGNAQDAKKSAGGNPFWLGLPFLIGIGGAVGLEALLLVAWPELPFELGMSVALFASAVAAALQNKGGWRIALQVLAGRKLWSMILLIAAIFIYQQTLKEAGAVQQMADMSGAGALMASALLLPFVVGLVSGISIAYVGASFPLLIGVLSQLGLGHQLEAYIVLGSFAGFSGVMISPIHICFMLTCQYFGTDLGTSWRKIAPMCLILAGSGIPWFFYLLSGS